MPGEAEWRTRKKRIDPKLDAAGWGLRGREAHRTEEEDTSNGPIASSLVIIRPGDLLHKHRDDE